MSTVAAGPSAVDPEVTISPMRRRHLPQVLDIETRVYPKPWSLRLFQEELARPARSYVVARVGARVVGYAGLLMIVDDGHVATVAVDPDWQGRRLGTRLLLALIEDADELGAHQLTLEVRMSNAPAQALYRRFGFVPAGARKGYYADNNEDALVMWVHETTGPQYRDRLAEIAASLPSPTRRQDLPADAIAATGAPATRHPAARTVEEPAS